MKKRILSLLLVLCMLLAMIPGITAAAAENTKDGSTANKNTTTSTPTDSFYDLYVTNGLVALFDAFGGTNNSTIDLTAGTWTSKAGSATGATATIYGGAYDAANNALGWTTDQNGLGYTGEWKPAAEGEEALPSSYVHFGDQLLSADPSSFTVEFTMRLKTSDTLDTDCANAWRVSNVSASIDFPGNRNFSIYPIRIFLNSGGGWKTAIEPHRWDPPYAAVTARLKRTEVMTWSFVRTLSKENTYAWKMLADGAVANEGPDGDFNAIPVDATEPNTNIAIGEGMPITLYSVRVYNRGLNSVEIAQNTFVDMALMTGLDLDKYNALNDTQKEYLPQACAAFSLNSVTKQDLENAIATIDTWIDLNVEEEGEAGTAADMANTLYVKDGLTVLLSAFSAFDTGIEAIDGGYNWLNGVDNTQYGTLAGDGWRRAVGGGMRIDETIKESQLTAMSAAHKTNYGLSFDFSLLPTKDYTVELVVNPVGMTYRDSNGNLQRAVDSTSSYGIYHEDGFTLGPLRDLQFASMRSGVDGKLEKRWFYATTGSWNGGNHSTIVRDYSWATTTMSSVVTYAITHGYTEENSSPSSEYYFYNNHEPVFTNPTVFSGKGYIDPAATDGKFRLMYGVAGTLYSVRVYNRVLTDVEMQQNHVADLIYYYGLDATLFQSLIKGMDDPSSFFAVFADMGFNMTKEEAQAEFNSRMSGIWIEYAGVAVRTDYNDGLRFYFDIDRNSIDSILTSGADISLGAIVNLGKQGETAQPTLDNAQYKIEVFNSTVGYVNGFFVDEDTFCVTILAPDSMIEDYLTEIAIRGYVHMPAAEGSEKEDLTFFAEVDEKEYQNTFFSIYNYKSEVIEDEFLAIHFADVVDSCFIDHIVYLDNSKDGVGDGTAENPYTDFITAFNACKELMGKVEIPTNVILQLQEGTYSLSEVATLAKSDYSNTDYVRFTVCSDFVNSGIATLTSTVALDNSLFTRNGNIWTYQFEKDANGNYPQFRNLYIDDGTGSVLAQLAQRGTSYAASGTVYKTPVGFFSSAPYYAAETAYLDGTLAQDPTYVPEQFANRADLKAEYEKYREAFLNYDADADPKKENYPVLEGTESIVGMDALKQLKEQIIKNGKFYLSIDQLGPLYDLAKTRLETAVSQANLDKPAYDEVKALYDAGKLTAASTAVDADPAAFAKYQQLFLDYMLWVQVSNEIISLYDSFNKDEYDHTFPTDRTFEPENPNASEEYKALFASTVAAVQAACEKHSVHYGADEKNAVWEIAGHDDTMHSEAQCVPQEPPYDEASFAKTIIKDISPEWHCVMYWYYNIAQIWGIDYNDRAVVTNEDGTKTTVVAIYIDSSTFVLPGDNSPRQDSYVLQNKSMYLTNAPQFLDQNGEYYYDQANGTLSYYSKSDISDLTIAYPTLERLFELNGAYNVTFSDLNFTGTDDMHLEVNGLRAGQGSRDNRFGIFPDRSAIYAQSVYGLTLNYCSFDNLPCEAVSLYGRTEDITVTNSSFTNLGSSALRLISDVDGRYNENAGTENALIEQNYISNVSKVYHGSSALMLGSAKDVQVLNNTFTDSSYSAISLGWRWGSVDFIPGDGQVNLTNVEVAYNFITNFMTEGADGGAIYSLGGNAITTYNGYLNSLHDNFIVFSKTTGDGTGGMICGIYHDEGSSHWHDYNNVIVEQSAEADREDTTSFMRRRGTYYVYTQDIKDATHCIKYDTNYFLNVRETNKQKQYDEVYNYRGDRQGVVAERNITESGSQYYNSASQYPEAIKNIIYSTGCYDYPGDPEFIAGNDY